MYPTTSLSGWWYSAHPSSIQKWVFRGGFEVRGWVPQEGSTSDLFPLHKGAWVGSGVLKFMIRFVGLPFS